MDEINTTEDGTPIDPEEVETEEVETETEEEDTTVDVPETFTFAGRTFPSAAEAEQAYKEMQQRATKAEQEKKKLEATIAAEKATKEFQALDPEEKMDRLAELMFSKDTQVEEEEEVTTVEAPSDLPEVEAYAQGHPILSEYPALAQQFVHLATTQYQGYTLDSIYDAVIQPMVDGLAGKKVSVKRKVVGGSKAKSGLTNEAIAAMSPAEYEKNREAILKFLTTQ